MITQSENISNIAMAFIKAQNEFEPIIKTAKGYNYKYAPLDNCYNATRKALFNNGLGVTQPLTYKESGIQVLETKLLHTSGEFFCSYTDFDIGQFQFIALNEKDNKKSVTFLQTWGSSLTHLRRYAYCAMLGIIGEDEDTDGTIEVPVTRAKVESIDEVGKLIQLIRENGCNPIEFTKFHGISSKEPATVKNALSNFKEMLVRFNNSSIIGE